MDREHVGGWCIDLNVSRYIWYRWYSAAVVYLLFLEVYGVSIGISWADRSGGDGMRWDGRRAGWHFIGWRFGVGGVMIFVVVFVVVFAPEWKRGEWRKRRGGKGREGEKRE